MVGRIDTSLITSHADGSIKAYLDWICVLKTYRHKGIAQLLMSAVKNELKKCGIDVLVGIVSHNDDALNFFHAIPGVVIEDESIWININYKSK